MMEALFALIYTMKKIFGKDSSKRFGWKKESATPSTIEAQNSA
jgi:hypothetical protein